MSRTFAYLRVSTVDQTTDNQIQEIAAAGSMRTPIKKSRAPMILPMALKWSMV